MNYTNTSNIAMPLAVFLASDDYDYHPNTISATAIMKSTRQHVLTKRVSPNDAFIDVSSLVPARMGTAIHSGIEKAWLNPNLPNVLKSLGQPKRIYENVIINPTAEQLAANELAVPIYMEIRTFKDIAGYRVSGMFDFVGGGKVQDFKSTSVYTYIYQSKVEDYQLQLSIYRLLNPEIINKDTALVHYIFTDWSRATAERTTNYPPTRVLTQELELLTIEQTLAYIKKKLSLITQYMHAPEPQIPLCTSKELWRKEDSWKYYANPAKTGKSTKNFKSSAEASAKFVQDGSKGLVKHIPGKVMACNYCPAFSLCTQKDALIANGELEL